MNTVVRKDRLWWLTFLLCTPMVAAPLDDIGVTALRSVTTNLNGASIRVAQPEAIAPAFEVNPSGVGQPANLFTYASSAGVDTNFPNSVGSESNHAKDVANHFYGLPDGVATNVAHVGNYDADYFVDYYVVSNLATLDAAIVNQSFTYGVLSVTDQQSTDSLFDDYAALTGKVFVSAACNADISTYVCSPGTAYNCISVGAYLGNSSIGPTPDNGRCKPDITAPGGATSFSTPYVAGVAAVLMQAAGRGDGGNNTNGAADLRTIKALLLNGAVKPLDWTNASSSPLDARYGAGVLNAMNSYAQLAGGQKARNFSTNIPAGTPHLPAGVTNAIPVLSGWDFNTNSTTLSSDAVSHYFFNVTNAAGGGTFAATLTLAWSRHRGQANINDLDLFLYNAATSNLVAMSTSRVDNVEHIYLPQLAAGRYDLAVVKYGGPGVVSSRETYALAWEFISPTLQIARSGTNTMLQWPVYPAGYLVEAETNLASGAWSTNSLPGVSTITNGRNSIPLSTTNALQFFRLRKPNL